MYNYRVIKDGQFKNAQFRNTLYTTPNYFKHLSIAINMPLELSSSKG